MKKKLTITTAIMLVVTVLSEALAAVSEAFGIVFGERPLEEMSFISSVLRDYSEPDEPYERGESQPEVVETG